MGGFAAAVPLGMKLNHLRYVLSAAEQGSFRRAAASLNIQQSTISRRVRELEDRLGAPLFEREAAGVRLTRDGQQFLTRVRVAVTELAAAADLAGAAGRAERGLLRIGLVQPLGRGFLSILLQRLLEARAAAAFTLLEAGPEAHLAALAARQLDLAFLPQPQETRALASRPLWCEDVVAVMRCDPGVVRRSSCSWSELADETLLIADDVVGAEIASMRSGAGAPLWPASPASLLQMAALGQGVAVLAASLAVSASPDLMVRPIEGAAIGFSAVWSPRNEKPALRRGLRIAGELSAAAQADRAFGPA